MLSLTAPEKRVVEHARSGRAAKGDVRLDPPEGPYASRLSSQGQTGLGERGTRWFQQAVDDLSARALATTLNSPASGSEPLAPSLCGAGGYPETSPSGSSPSWLSVGRSLHRAPRHKRLPDLPQPSAAPPAAWHGPRSRSGRHRRPRPPPRQRRPHHPHSVPE